MKNIVLAAVLCAAAAVARAADPPNSCAECHKTVAGVPYMEHNYADWESSVHAKAGLDCQKCHGGDPDEGDKAAAHKGMRPSSDPKSPVYFTKVPGTCGQCHEQELAAFKRSRHYKELADTGRGPNCVTCHGSMANHVLEPRELEMTCTLCHRKPTQAYAARMALEEARVSLRKLDAALQFSDEEEAKKKYQEALELHGEAVRQWHTFNMVKVQEEAAKSARLAATTLKELKDKRGGSQP